MYEWKQQHLLVVTDLEFILIWGGIVIVLHILYNNYIINLD
jgi:hypothetical protein